MTRRNSTVPHSSIPNFNIDLEHNKYKKHSATHSQNHTAQMLIDVPLHFSAASVPKPHEQAAHCNHTTHDFMGQGTSSSSTASRNINAFGGSCATSCRLGWASVCTAHKGCSDLDGNWRKQPHLSWTAGC